MSKPVLSNEGKRLDTQRVTRSLWLAVGLCTMACRTAPAEPAPAWPRQQPPPYPGTSPEPGAVPPAGGSAPASSSPLASEYGERPVLERLAGKATYYADSLAGNSTASGEPYQPEAFSAAHRSLPFGSIVRVTRQDVERVTYVKVNDRGPFAGKDRIIDLSRAAATELDMLRAGVVPVTVEVLALPAGK